MPNFRSRLHSRNRRKTIESLFSMPLGQWLSHEYAESNKSCDQISEELESQGIPMTPKTISRWLKELDIPLRDKKSAFRLAIESGRMSYEHQKSTSKRKRKVLSSKIRFSVMKRNGFRCVFCGQGAKQGAVLEVGHIIDLKDGGSDELDNLRTECFDCNHGH